MVIFQRAINGKRQQEVHKEKNMEQKVANLSYADYRVYDVGFRCVSPVLSKVEGVPQDPKK